MKYQPTVVSRGHYGSTELPDHILSHIRLLIDDSIFKSTPLVYTVYRPYSHEEGYFPFIITMPKHTNRFRACNRIRNYFNAYERLWSKIYDFVSSLRLDRSHLNLKWFTEEDVEFIARKSYELFGAVGSYEEDQDLVAFADLGQNEREMVVRTVKTILECPEAPRYYLHEPEEARQTREDFYEIVINQAENFQRDNLERFPLMAKVLEQEA